MNMNENQLKPYFIIAQTWGIKLLYSMQINLPNPSTEEYPKEYFLYPHNYISELDRIQQSLDRIRSHQENEFDRIFSHNSYIKKDETASIFIIIQAKLDLSQNIENIKKLIKNYCDPLLILLDLIFTIRLELNPICILSYNKIGYHLERSISQIKKRMYNPDFPLMQFVHSEAIEYYFPMLMKNYIINRSYYPMINELLWGKTNRIIQIRLMFLWNALEHLTREYHRKNQQSESVNGIILSEIKSLIKPIIKYVLSKNLNDHHSNKSRLESIIESRSERIKESIRDESPIKKLIYSMYGQIFGEQPSPEIREVVDIIKKIRDKMYHERSDDEFILELMHQKNPNFTFQDLVDLDEKFLTIVEKILFRLMGFTPDFLEFQTSYKISHTLKWKNPSIGTTDTITEEYLQKLKLPDQTIDTVSERERNYELQMWTRRNNFEALLRYLESKKDQIINILTQNKNHGIITFSQDSTNEKEIIFHLESDFSIVNITFKKPLLNLEIPFDFIKSSNFLNDFSLLLYGHIQSIESGLKGKFRIFWFDLKRNRDDS